MAFSLQKLCAIVIKKNGINIRELPPGLQKYCELVKLCCLNLNTKTCKLAAENGHLNCLKYAHENGCPWDSYTCSNAAENGHLDCLKYAHENGCPWTKFTCLLAAENGHFDCLKYAHENGCPWDGDTCFTAALFSYFDCLKDTHENGYSWHRFTGVLDEYILASVYETVARDHLDCLKYTNDNGGTCFTATLYGHLKCGHLEIHRVSEGRFRLNGGEQWLQDSKNLEKS